MASQRKCTQGLAKRSRKEPQVINLRLLACPFDQGLKILIFPYCLVGKHKSDFIPDLVGPFLEMTLIPHSGKLISGFRKRYSCRWIVNFTFVAERVNGMRDTPYARLPSMSLSDQKVDCSWSIASKLSLKPLILFMLFSFSLRFQIFVELPSQFSLTWFGASMNRTWTLHW